LSRAFRLPVLLATLLAALAFSSGAQGSIVIVGSPNETEVVGFEFGGTDTVLNKALG
jgi:phosphomannomutase